MCIQLRCVTISTYTIKGIYIIAGSGGVARWQCPMCHKLLSTRSNLKIHVADKHSTLQHAFPCPVCGNVYKTRNSLHNHLSIRHRGVRMPRHPGVPVYSRPQYDVPTVHPTDLTRHRVSRGHSAPGPPSPLMRMRQTTPPITTTSCLPLELTTTPRMRTVAIPYISPSSAGLAHPPLLPHPTHPSLPLIHTRDDLLTRDPSRRSPPPSS